MDFFLLLLLVAASLAYEDDKNRPSISSENGNLIITPGFNKNISFAVNGKMSHVNFEGTEIDQLIVDVKSHVKKFQKFQTNIDWVDETTSHFKKLVSDKMKDIDGKNSTNVTSLYNKTFPLEFSWWRRRLDSLEIKMNVVILLLATNECSSNPCKHGGTCIDDYKKVVCLCNSGWEGADCSIDVNECQLFQGSIHGCQNGGTCTNLPGSFVCACPSGWYGLNCHLRSHQCSAGTNSEICGHGTCIQQANGFSCICELGWQTNGVAPECIVDVDECSGNHHPCSAIPFVPCINTPGSFKCGSCPKGYYGSGFYCVDINECQDNNGGCSTNPSVLCHNTIGSRECAACPPGYEGDGITCKYKGLCEMNNGGCHPLAKCTTNPAISSSYVMCTCPVGFIGTGIGENGCVPGHLNPHVLDPHHCSTNCRHGLCRHTFDGVRCICDPGFAGVNCDKEYDPCASHPCQSGGTCIKDKTIIEHGYRCECTAAFTGENCQTESSACRDTKVAMEGNLAFPEGSEDYKNNSQCIWVIETNQDKVLNLTFTRFSLEESADHGCIHDWLEIYDGADTSYHKMGRFCGQQLSNNTSIISTRSAMVIVFKSDASITHSGFSLHWNSIVPMCGGSIKNAEQGEIISPGYPGKYPEKTDCIWKISVKPGKHIEFSFTTFHIGIHSDCDHDYLKIFDGTSDSDTVLNSICNSSLPRSVVSTGPDAMVHFHSGEADHNSKPMLGYMGFKFSYSSKPAIAGCGGIFTTRRGELHSPSFEGAYLSNLVCEYLITPPGHGKIKIKFLQFELEGMDLCEFDHVQIFDGDSVNSPSSPKYCGDILPKDFYSTGDKLLVLFKSDWSTSGKGFKIQYEQLCENVFTADSGIFSSPNYPRPYPLNIKCTYLISLPINRVIILNFLDFDIEHIGAPECVRFDNIMIYDGDDSSSPLLGGPFCGTNITKILISTRNMLFLEFYSDSSINGAGWQANYTSIDKGCGGIIKKMTGSLTYPSTEVSETAYRHNMTCEWILSAPPGYIIQITWDSFHLETAKNSDCNDYLEIEEYHVVARNKKPNRRYCGSNKPPSFMTSTNILIVKFYSNKTMSSTGFSFTYRFDNEEVCGGQYVSQSGTITSPGWPNSPSSEIECNWIISVPTGLKISLHIPYLNEGMFCSSNRLIISAGNYSLAPVLGKFCNITTPMNIISPTNSMKLNFNYDGSMEEGGGFEATWESMTADCGGILQEYSGTIMSPNYPEEYVGETDCLWRIHTNPGSLLELTFMDIRLDSYPTCQYDYVELFNSENTETNLIGRYCNEQHALKPILTKSNFVFIKFRSGSFREKSGFLLKYHSVCNSDIMGFSGVIESPNFPESYPVGINCTWKISVPTGNQINVMFTHFSLYDYDEQEYNNCKDFVQIISEEKSGNKYFTYCGARQPPMFTSTENQTFIHFESNHFIQNSGFRIEWRILGCGGLLRSPSGELRTGERLGYIRNKQCNWIIEVDQGMSVELLIERYEINHRSNGQSITVYGGLTKNDQKVLEFNKAKLQKATYTSSGNYMFVSVFSNDDGLYFSANYKAVHSICGGTFTTPTGVIHSPNYPRNYNSNSSCYWYISVENYHRVQITFDDFDLVETNKCLDYVNVYDGYVPKNESLLLNKCGSNKQNDTITSTSNKMLVMFFTSGTITAKGFAVTYKTSCGQVIRTESRGFLSPDPSIFIGNNIGSCEWNIITSNSGDRVSLTFTHIDLYNDMPKNSTPCPNQYIEVYSGESSTAPLIGRYCGVKIPPTIVGRGNALTIVLSPIDEPRRLFSAHYSVLSSFCGGELTSEEGEFTSPGYPDTYSADSDCVWTVKLAPGNRISYSFLKFDVGMENCDLDYLEFRENDGVGKVLETYCGGKIPSTVTVNSSVWIKFHSAHDSTGPGFVISYAFVHFNEFDDLENGTIASPMYPKRYTGSKIYRWRINMKFEQTAQVTIKNTEFSMENKGFCMSYLAIYDGYDEKAPLLQKMCDDTEPNRIESTSHIIFVEFNSYNDPVGSLFLLEWNAIITSTDPLINSTCRSETTLFIPKDQIKTLQSPGYPHGYAHHLECSWTFETHPDSHLVLKFKDMSLEHSPQCHMDRVVVYSKRRNSQKWDEIGKYCFPNITSQIIETESNLIKVDFLTDHAKNFTGFEAQIYPMCGGEVNEPAEILKPSFANVDSRNHAKECKWKVKVKPGRRIKIDALIIIVNSTIPCSNYVMLHDGISDEFPYLGQGKYCNNYTLDQSLETTRNYLFVKFMFETYVGTMGLSYSEISESCETEIYLNSDMSSMIISSPNYPKIPTINTECSWKIRAPVGERIRIDFLEFDLAENNECINEYLEIRDGGTEISELIKKLCSSKKPVSQKSSGNMMYIKYLTDLKNPKPGFKANVTIDYCGGTFDSNYGIIRQPTKAQLLAMVGDINCEWRLIVPITHNVIMNLSVNIPLSKDCQNANIQIADLELNDTEHPISEKLCGFDQTFKFSSIKNRVIVRMLISKSIIRDSFDFKLKYNTSQQECGGKVFGNEGTIESFPLSPPSTRFCEWIIEVDEGRRITFKVLKGFVENIEPYVYEIKSSEYHSYIPFNTSDIPFLDSSSNQLLITYTAHSGPDYVQFKATYTSEKPTPCGKTELANEGKIVPPADDNIYHCIYNYKMENNKIDGKTIVFNITNIVFNSTEPTSEYCKFDSSHIFVYRGTPYNPYIRICNSTENAIIIRSSFPKTILEVQKRNKSEKVGYTIEYKVLPCGGIFQVEMSDSSFINFKLPENYSKSLDCAWIIQLPRGFGKATINLNNITLTNKDCNKESYLIKDLRYPGIPAFKNWCQDAIEVETFHGTNRVIFEYRSDKFYNTTFLQLSIQRVAKCMYGKCGRYLSISTLDSVFHTTNFPGNYNNNEECLWEIRGLNGNRIELSFEKQFSIEQSPNCTKDYVEILEQKNNDWIPIIRYCGRNTPKNYTSDSNELNVFFRSDSSITNTGFQVRWNSFCGGTYQASKELKSINYPDFLYSKKVCRYVIQVNKGENLKLDFKTFKLNNECSVENMTIQPYQEHLVDDKDMITYCGMDSPGVKLFKNGAIVYYSKKYWTFGAKYEFTYSVDDCGGAINTSKIISMQRDTGSFHCIWNITAPSDKVIIIRFLNFLLPTARCESYYIEFFEGSEMNKTKNIYKFCGVLNVQPPIVKSETNKAILSLKVNDLFSKLDIEAEIDFVKACDGTVHVNSSYEFEISDQYGSLLDCHWQFLAPDDKILKVSFSSFNISYCHNCSCSFLEFRDGEGPNSDFMAKYCGDSKLEDVVSSKDRIWLRFFSDGTNSTLEIKATITAEPSFCGNSILGLNHTSQTLTPPLDSDGYVIKGIRCTWILPFSDEYFDIALISFKNIDLEPPKTDVCIFDYLEISNVILNIEKSVERTQIVNGLAVNNIKYIHNPDTYDEEYTEYFSYLFCGKVKSSNFYLFSTDLKITLVTSSKTTTKHRGFSMEYKFTDCSGNYTAESGKMLTSVLGRNTDIKKTCTSVIKVASNRTIALYFQRVNFHDTNSSITIRDGDSISSKVIGTIKDNNYKPLPYFSTGNALFIESFVKLYNYQHFISEATYMSTDAGRGCGGFIHDHTGIIYSPLYPLPYRGKSPCEWIIETPHESLVALKFKEFNLGPLAHCDVDYLELRNTDNEQIAKYCPRDKPADYTSQKNYIKIIYHTSHNNGGSGWVIIFDAKHYIGEILK